MSNQEKQLEQQPKNQPSLTTQLMTCLAQGNSLQLITTLRNNYYGPYGGIDFNKVPQPPTAERMPAMIKNQGEQEVIKQISPYVVSMLDLVNVNQNNTTLGLHITV